MKGLARPAASTSWLQIVSSRSGAGASLLSAAAETTWASAKTGKTDSAVATGAICAVNWVPGCGGSMPGEWTEWTPWAAWTESVTVFDGVGVGSGVRRAACSANDCAVGAWAVGCVWMGGFDAGAADDAGRETGFVLASPLPEL